jgi:hypothetical protein
MTIRVKNRVNGYIGYAAQVEAAGKHKTDAGLIATPKGAWTVTYPPGSRTERGEPTTVHKFFVWMDGVFQQNFTKLRD